MDPEAALAARTHSDAIVEPFSPPSWLRHPDVQTIVGNLPIWRAYLALVTRRLRAATVDHELDCGGGVRLHGQLARHAAGNDRDLVLLLHGWEGDADSGYMLSSASYLFDHGFDVFRLHLRDHGPSHHLNRGLFHANRLDEVLGAALEIQERFVRGRLFLGGFSLGGNFVVRLALHGPRIGLSPTRAVAVCPVLDPRNTLRALDTGLAFYRTHFLRNWQASLERKGRYFPGMIDLAAVRRTRSIYELTDYLIRTHTDFSDTPTYLAGYRLTGDVLATLEVPTVILAAEDDPVIPAEDLDRLARPDALEVIRFPHGGHCGFFEHLGHPGWMERQLHRLFTSSLHASREDALRARSPG